MLLSLVRITILLFLLVDIAASKVLSAKDEVLQYENQPWDGKQYSFRYETKNGVNWRQSGILRTSENGNPFVSVSGKFSYPLDNGLIMTVEYEAADNGYQIKHMKLIPYGQLTSEQEVIKAMNPEPGEDDDSLLDDRVTDSRAAASLLG